MYVHALVPIRINTIPLYAVCARADAAVCAAHGNAPVNVIAFAAGKYAVVVAPAMTELIIRLLLTS